MSARIVLASVAAAAALTAADHSAAATLTTLHGFCSQTNCRDGDSSNQSLLMDAAGNLFGTTLAGGAHSKGVVFELQHTDGGYLFRRPYMFCAEADCADGVRPTSGLIADTAGNLYGTTAQGGAFGGGTVFKLEPPPQPWQLWTLVKLHDFRTRTGCADGKTPIAGLTYQGGESGVPYDGVSPLFGTTSAGGTAGDGAAFQLAFAAGHRPRVTVIHNFCVRAGCADGISPNAPMTMDANGNLYGTTNYGGAFGGDFAGGVVFELAVRTRGYHFGVLHDFCAAAGCADGQFPFGGLTFDGSGNLYGVTTNGGATGNGTVFKVVPHGARSTHTVLYSFCPVAGNCVDGADPNARLVIDETGDIIGTTNDGGTNPQPAGTIFKLQGGAESLLYSFCQNCADGAYPVGGVVVDGSGNLFGTTFEFGPEGQGGTVFELTP